MSATAPSGLYYVDRDATRAYLLSGAEFPNLDAIDRDILYQLVFGPGYSKAYTSRPAPGEGRAQPVSPDSSTHNNMIGLPFGLYYVDRTGVIYDLGAPGRLVDLHHMDSVLLRGYITNAVSAIQRIRAGR